MRLPCFSVWRQPIQFLVKYLKGTEYLTVLKCSGESFELWVKKKLTHNNAFSCKYLMKLQQYASMYLKYGSCLNIVFTSYRNQSEVKLATILYFVCYQDNLMWYLVKMKNTREFHLISLQHWSLFFRKKMVSPLILF